MKILLPIDGSVCADHTLTWAIETFNQTQARYYLLYVIPVMPDLNTVEYDIIDANALLRRTRNRLESAGGMVVETNYLLGDIVEQICQYAEAIEADQIVIGSHGRTGLAKLLMGSTSIKVLEHSQRPVTLHRNINTAGEEDSGMTRSERFATTLI